MVEIAYACSLCCIHLTWLLYAVSGLCTSRHASVVSFIAIYMQELCRLLCTLVAAITGGTTHFREVCEPYLVMLLDWCCTASLYIPYYSWRIPTRATCRRTRVTRNRWILTDDPAIAYRDNVWSPGVHDDHPHQGAVPTEETVVLLPRSKGSHHVGKSIAKTGG